MSLGENSFLIFSLHDGTFIPYNQNNIIVVAAEVLDSPSEVEIGGYVGDCSYRHKSICMYNIVTKKIDTLVSIEDGYAGGLMLHDNDILEYRCGSEMTLDTLCLYDIKEKQEHTICTYEPYENDIINTLADKVYYNRNFYYMRFEDESLKKSSIYNYNLNDKSSKKVSTGGLPCIYNKKAYIKISCDESIQLIDMDTKECVVGINTDNELYSVYSSNSCKYFSNTVLNNETQEIYHSDNGKLTRFSAPKSCVYFNTDTGIYVYSFSRNAEQKANWEYIPY